jgi:chlorobactene glucosyltransferase
VLAVLAAFLGIVVVNLAVLPRLEDVRTPAVDGQLRVAVLVPARNEESNIEGCVRSLLAQDYRGLEIWVYDDASTDGTLGILRRLESEVGAARMYIVQGTKGPPAGWLGKANACHRLYEAMRAEREPDYLLFTDADVRFAPSAVSRAVATAVRHRAGLLSIFPRQVTVTWAERMAVPLLSHWGAYNFLPLPLAFTLRSGPAFAAANGQFMLFSTQAYEACGGHEVVRSQVLEDVGLARAVKRAGYRALLADGGPLIRTRMYGSAREVWEGYSKNVYEFFGYSVWLLAVGVVGLLVLYVLPLLLAAVFVPSAVGWVFAAQYGVGVLTRVAIAGRFGYRVVDCLLHPVAVLYLIAIAVNSMLWARTGRGAWKGRRL